jgi:hypothetical protein
MVRLPSNQFILDKPAFLKWYLVEGSGLLCRDPASQVKWFLLRPFKPSRTVYLKTQSHKPGDLNPRSYRCEKLKS